MKKTVLLSLSLCFVLVGCATETVQRPTMGTQQAKRLPSEMVDQAKWNDGNFIVKEEDVRETIRCLNWLDSMIDNPMGNLLVFQKASPVYSGFVLLRNISE